MREERWIKGAERCHLHAGATAVDRCEECGRPVCLACAVPVRGKVIGLECLPVDVRTGGTAGPARPTAAATATGLAVVVALVATILPWARQGRWFGAWVWPFRGDFPWSMVVAPAALLACVVWWSGRRRDQARRTGAAVAVLSALVAAGAVLAIDRPPEFTRPFVGPHLAVVAGLAGLVAGLAMAALPGRRARTMS